MDSKTIFIIAVVVLSALILLSFGLVIKNNAQRASVQKQLVLPEKYSTIIVEETKKKEKKKKKDFFIVKMIKEYIFFFGSAKKVIFLAVFGYLALFVVMYLVTNEILFSILISFSYFGLLYMHLDGKISKKRKQYIKDFASAINVLYTSAEAGNTIEASIKQVVERDTIGPRMRTEFGNINKDLLNNMSLSDALESFYERNKTFQEVGMFVIIMQFYAQKGGDGLKDILSDIAESLNGKITAYAEIAAELGIYSALINVFVYGYFCLLIGIKVFMPTFYPEMFDYGMQYVQAFASVFLYIFAIWFYKSMMRGTAEG